MFPLFFRSVSGVFPTFFWNDSGKTLETDRKKRGNIFQKKAESFKFLRSGIFPEKEKEIASEASIKFASEARGKKLAARPVFCHLAASFFMQSGLFYAYLLSVLFSSKNCL